MLLDGVCSFKSNNLLGHKKTMYAWFEYGDSKLELKDNVDRDVFFRALEYLIIKEQRDVLTEADIENFANLYFVDPGRTTKFVLHHAVKVKRDRTLHFFYEWARGDLLTVIPEGAFLKRGGGLAYTVCKLRKTKTLEDGEYDWGWWYTPECSFYNSY